jgi:hypothetical protein
MDETGGGKPLFSYNHARRGVKHGERANPFARKKKGVYHGRNLYTPGNLKNLE